MHKISHGREEIDRRNNLVGTWFEPSFVLLCCSHTGRKADTREWERRYQTDATFQTAQQRENHPVRKILHMQKCYPETVLRLNQKGDAIKRDTGSASNGRPTSSRWHRNPSPNNKNSAPEASRQATRCTKTGQQDLFDDAATQRVAHEYQFCHDKMAYNRTKGRYVIAGAQLQPLSPVIVGTAVGKGRKIILPSCAAVVPHPEFLFFGVVRRNIFLGKQRWTASSQESRPSRKNRRCFRRRRRTSSFSGWFIGQATRISRHPQYRGRENGSGATSVGKVRD